MKKELGSAYGYLDALKKRVLVFDGAMGTSLQVMSLTSEDFGGERFEGCNDYLVISKPQVVESVHRSFLEAGADVIETDTFRANRITLSDYDLADQTHSINRAAASLARRLADEYATSARPRFVAGSVGPTGKLPSANDPDLSDISFDELVDVFREQAVGLIEGGADLLLIETSQDLLEVKAAIHGFQLAFDETGQRLPVQAQVTLDTSGRMLLGTDIAAAWHTLERLPIDVMGLNCSTGPEHMRDPIRYLGENARLPIACIPNAGLPLNVDGEAIYPLEPEPFTKDMVDFVKTHGVSIVGGCCGTTPAHIRSLVDALGEHAHPPRPDHFEPYLSSAIRATTMIQEPRPLLIGERINTQGSRQAKRLLLADDFDGIIELARAQVEQGAHVLDICVALTERADEAEMMREVVHRLAFSVEAPLVIDTTEPQVMEAALKANPGRSLINSVNLESGRSKLDQILSLARDHGAAVIALTIDEKGMAKTAERKLEVAQRIYAIAVKEYDFSPEDLIFDDLTFTLATGDPEFADSAIATLEGIRLIKSELPGVLTSLGVSNVSFGLDRSARPVINSVMLYHCVKAGLDMAIVNPAHITPYAEIADDVRILAEDLLFNRSPDALQNIIEHFQTIGPRASEPQEDLMANLSPEERLQWRIIHRHKEGVEIDIDKILERSSLEKRPDAAVNILNANLLPAMKEVGDRFGAGELILPFVLQSAEVMKIAVTHLEQFFERQQGVSKGCIVLATVYGDVHDIGKSLVKTILENNGYEVHDLGKQVPANVIVDQAIELQADAIGLSALLVSTSKQMPLIVNELQRRNLAIPVLIGGAAINRRFARRILFTEDGSPYAPGVFYCKDAFEGLQVMDQLQDDEQRSNLVTQHLEQAQRDRDVVRTVEHSPESRSTVLTAETIPSPPSWGSRVVAEMPLEIVFQDIFKKELFRLSWGAKNAQGSEWDELRNDFESRLAGMQKQALSTGWLQPQGVYGYWPAQSQGNGLILYTPDSVELGKPQELMRFNFPRQPKGPALCLADYFAPLDSDVMDVVALQVVTVGSEATAYVNELQESGDYTEAYFAHGLAVQTAEAAAQYLHSHIRRELGINVLQGKRYSWGYPSIPDLADHAKVFELLPAARALGMQLSPAYQLIPEQSTAAIILHHPEAKYFSVGVSRVEQLTNEHQPSPIKDGEEK